MAPRGIQVLIPRIPVTGTLRGKRDESSAIQGRTRRWSEQPGLPRWVQCSYHKCPYTYTAGGQKGKGQRAKAEVRGEMTEAKGWRDERRGHLGGQVASRAAGGEDASPAAPPGGTGPATELTASDLQNLLRRSVECFQRPCLG